MAVLDFWFDYSCPYAYVASTQVEALAARAGATLRWRPMLLGGVFRAVATPQNLATTMSPAKARYLLVDQQRLADRAGVLLRHPPEHPRRTVSALRATLARDNDPAVIHAFYRAYWVDGRAIEDPEVVRAIAGDVDLETAREPLRVATEEAIALGIFGAPAYVVAGRLWWGSDRQHFVEAALRGAA
jgi:2-hydroxychromene-2-carboxylate isomerase